LSLPDPYARIDYDLVVDWISRLRREGPFLERTFSSSPTRRLLDLGCGTGEHSRWLAQQGFEVVGVDRSEAQLEKARQAPNPPGVSFVDGRIEEVGRLVTGPFGGALSIGNTLPGLTTAKELGDLFGSVRALLPPGAPFLIQILNYEKIFATHQRFLPPIVRDTDDGPLVFLRLMDPRADGTVRFTPSLLRWHPDREPPLEIVASNGTTLRGWRREEIEALLDEAGFADRTLHGGIPEQPFEPATSGDLVVVAR
jgi:SAM-dependent methyltransferase